MNIEPRYLINKRVYKAELDKYINLGWSIGMLKRK